MAMTDSVRARPLAKWAVMPPILPRRCVGSASIRATQPVRQQSGRFVRRAAVERHQCRRHSRDTDDVGAPPILGDVRHFDEIRVAGDRLFEAMNGVGHELETDA